MSLITTPPLFLMFLLWGLYCHDSRASHGVLNHRFEKCYESSKYYFQYVHGSKTSECRVSKATSQEPQRYFTVWSFLKSLHICDFKCIIHIFNFSWNICHLLLIIYDNTQVVFFFLQLKFLGYLEHGKLVFKR